MIFGLLKCYILKIQVADILRVKLKAQSDNWAIQRTQLGDETIEVRITGKFPVSVFYDVFLSFLIRHKIASVATKCAHWRKLSLSYEMLWNCICVTTTYNYKSTWIQS